jgi:hypothetical protein
MYHGRRIYKGLLRRNYCTFKVRPKGGKGSRGATLEGSLEKGILKGKLGRNNEIPRE